MRLDTNSGLHGQVIAYGADLPASPELGGTAVLLRDEVPFADRPYSVHHVCVDEYGTWSSNIAYDLTLDEAMDLLRARTLV